jgi:hypothetical protein
MIIIYVNYYKYKYFIITFINNFYINNNFINKFYYLIIKYLKIIDFDFYGDLTIICDFYNLKLYNKFKYFNNNYNFFQFKINNYLIYKNNKFKYNIKKLYL